MNAFDRLRLRQGPLSCRWLARVIWITATLFSMLGASAGPQARNRPGITYSIDAPMVEIPFDYVQHQILIHGEAAGQKELTLLFDTGASMPVFDTDIPLVAIPLQGRSIQEADGTSSVSAMMLDSLTLGQMGQSVRARHIAALVSDLSQITSLIGRKIDGIVGLSFMAGYVIELDYNKRIIRFVLPKRSPIAKLKPDNLSTFLLPLSESAPSQPVSSLMVSGKLAGDFDTDFVLDTGFGGYVSVARSTAELSGLLKRNTPRVQAESFSVSRRFRSEKIRADFLMLGAINVSNRIVQIDTRNGDAYGQHGILGNRLLQNYRLILDCTGHKLWLERTTKREEPDESEKPRLGLTVRVEAGRICIEKVSPGSPAARAGVRAGDTILSIDGLALGTIGMPTALSVLASPDGPTDLELRHDKGESAQEERPVTLRIVPLSALDWAAE